VKKIWKVFAVFLSVLFFVPAVASPRVQAEDLLRWKIMTQDGVSLGVVEGLTSVYSGRVIYYDPGGVSPNRCLNGCTFALDSYQNVQGTTTTSTATTTTTSTSTSTSTTTPASSSTKPFTGWTLRIAQLSQNQMQINGCLDNTGSTTPLIVTASWTVSKDGVTVGSGSGTSNGLILSGSSNPVCPTEFLANVSGLTASTEYVVTYTGGISGNIVTGSRTIITSNAPATTTSTSTSSTTSTTTIPKTTTTTTTVVPKVTTTVQPTSSTVVISGQVTTTTMAVVVDDGVEEGEVVADISLQKSGNSYMIRVASNREKTQMQIIARKKGAKNIVWTLTTDGNGAKGILTSRNLKGFTLALRVDGETVDTAKVS
jgi:hypothetical protein